MCCHGYCTRLNQGLSTVTSPWEVGWTSVGVGAGLLLADLVSGVFHWSVDNYGNWQTPVFGSVIEAFQGHHGETVYTSLLTHPLYCLLVLMSVRLCSIGCVAPAWCMSTCIYIYRKFTRINRRVDAFVLCFLCISPPSSGITLPSSFFSRRAWCQHITRRSNVISLHSSPFFFLPKHVFKRPLGSNDFSQCFCAGMKERTDARFPKRELVIKPFGNHGYA